MIFFSWENDQDIKRIECLLKEGRVVAGGTDTVLGLFCQATEKGTEQLNKIKKRSNKPYICLISDILKVKKAIDNSMHTILEKIAPIIWPGPVTILFKVSPLYTYASCDNLIAVRIPNHQGILKLLQHFDLLFSTSANIAGDIIPTSLKEVDLRIKNVIAGFISNAEGKKNVIPSVIIQIRNNVITIVRGTSHELPIQKLQDAGFSISK